MDTMTQKVLAPSGLGSYAAHSLGVKVGVLGGSLSAPSWGSMWGRGGGCIREGAATYLLI